MSVVGLCEANRESLATDGLTCLCVLYNRADLASPIFGAEFDSSYGRETGSI